jgi:hypothetical protein
MISRRLLMGGSGSFPGPPLNYVGLINAAATNAYAYVIGGISSSDGGATWTAASGSCIGPSGAGWRSLYVKDPCPVNAGSIKVYVHGWNGSNHQVGGFNATNWASVLAGTATEFIGNPILGVPNDGGWRENGAIFPYVVYDATLTPPWKMWVSGSHGVGGTFTIGFLDSTDGETWTDRGRVLNVGAGGSADEVGLEMGGVMLYGGTWYVYYGGIPASGFYHGCYATVPLGSEGTAGSYTKGGILSGWSGNVTVGGFTWRSNQPRQVFRRGGEIIALWDGWNASGFFEESCFVTYGSDPVTFPVPSSGLMIPLDDASWHSNSAENPVTFPVP